MKHEVGGGGKVESYLKLLNDWKVAFKCGYISMQY